MRYLFMYGRKKEIEEIEKLYNSSKFEFLVLYGRRRVGKTTLLTKFANGHNCFYFHALEKNDTLNINEFSYNIKSYFNLEYSPSISSWSDLILFLTEKIKDRLNKKPDEKVCIIIDEFPFIAKEYPTIKSILQSTIDHIWKDMNMMLVLCGSSVSFMINEVMGYSSPLYGRRTANIALKPLSYIDACKFYPNYSFLNKITSYCILGGIPYYLKTFSDSLSIKDNLINNVFSDACLLREEPLLLLKQEFREPTIYNSVIQAIATGSSKFHEISSKINEETSKCSIYIKNLQEINIIDKVLPYKESPTSKKSIYLLSDFYFRFWYKFIFSNLSTLNLIGPKEYTERIYNEIPLVLGKNFKEVCYQYMSILARNNQLPFIPDGMGKWWGYNPISKKQDEIDIMGSKANQGIFCECKFENKPFDIKELDDLLCSSEIFKEITKKYYYVFSKSGYTKAVIDKSKEFNIKLLTIDDLFKV